MLNCITLSDTLPIHEILTIMVAVAVPLAPPQHSPMFGHFASSQTYIKTFIIYILQKHKKTHQFTQAPELTNKHIYSLNSLSLLLLFKTLTV